MYTDSDTRSLHDTLPSFGSGAFSGFFGIGGGFLIVPGIVAATGMPMINAVGTSLVAVTAFGLTTAANYAWSGLRSEEHTSELQSLMRISYAVFCLTKNTKHYYITHSHIPYSIPIF